MAAAVVVVVVLQQVMIVGYVRLEVNPISHPLPVVAVSKWMEHPLYSPYLEKLTGAATPFEQCGFGVSIMAGAFYGIKSFMRSVYVLKADSLPVGSDDRKFYTHLSGCSNEQLEHALMFSRRIRARGAIGAILMPLGWLAYVTSKRSFDC